MKIILIFLASLFFARPASAWLQDAFRLIGEAPAVRAQAIANLKSEKHLERKIKEALKGSYRGYALDVISALRMDSLLPSLLREAQKDASGLTYLTITELISAKNRKNILRIYEDRLLCFSPCQVSGPTQVILLDTLARAGVPLEIGSLHRLMEDSSWPEVRMAVMNYVRHFALTRKDNIYLPLIHDGLGDGSFQVREQTLYLISELGWKEQISALRVLKNCDADFTPTARKLCEELRKKI